ncbi:MAG: DUF4114 domain-containing protein, partial [Cyanobacteriota bacterium]|nr:DUF4114 domain-containing protein [Cyanobacteriota bacterium]
ANNDEVAAELEIEVPETDEVAEIENVAQELESEIEESPSATESAEGEIGNANNDEVAAELEIEVPETDEVAEIENVAQELESEIEESPSARESAEVEIGDVNSNDEVAAELETEVPETDEVAEIENVALELESEIVESNNIIVSETEELNQENNGENSTVDGTVEIAEPEAGNNEKIETNNIDLEEENPADIEGSLAAETVDNTEEIAETETTDEALLTGENAEELEAIATSYPSIFDSGTFTVGSEGKVGIDFLADGGYYEGEIAIFSLEGMEEFEAGSPDFLKEAARRSLSDSELGHVVIDDKIEGARFSGKWPHEGDFNNGEYGGVKTFEMRSGDTFGVMLVPKGSVEKVFENPHIGGGNRPLFSMTTANPDDAFHVGQIADFDGEGNTFVMEDVRMDGNSDRDYNDVVFQVRGAKGNAIGLDEAIDVEKDWRDSDLGRGLVDYTKPYVVEETA